MGQTLKISRIVPLSYTLVLILNGSVCVFGKVP